MRTRSDSENTRQKKSSSNNSCLQLNYKFIEWSGKLKQIHSRWNVESMFNDRWNCLNRISNRKDLSSTNSNYQRKSFRFLNNQRLSRSNSRAIIFSPWTSNQHQFSALLIRCLLVGENEFLSKWRSLTSVIKACRQRKLNRLLCRLLMNNKSDSFIQ